MRRKRENVRRVPLGYSTENGKKIFSLCQKGMASRFAYYTAWRLLPSIATKYNLKRHHIQTLSGLFWKITFPGTPNFRWPFFRHLPPKKVSPPEIFPFSTQNFPVLHPKFSDDLLFSHLPQKITLHTSHFKEKFPPEIFRWLFKVFIYETKNSLCPFFFENVLYSGIFIQSYCFSRKGPGRSRY